MRAKTYKYLDPNNRKAYFRGYIERFDGATKIVTTCKEVRTNEKEALQDARRLMK